MEAVAFANARVVRLRVGSLNSPARGKRLLNDSFVMQRYRNPVICLTGSEDPKRPCLRGTAAFSGGTGTAPWSSVRRKTPPALVFYLDL